MPKPSIRDLNTVDDLFDLAVFAPKKKHDRATYYFNRVNDLLRFYYDAATLGDLKVIPLAYNDLSRAFRKLVKPLTTRPSWWDNESYDFVLASIIMDFFSKASKGDDDMPEWARP